MTHHNCRDDEALVAIEGFYQLQVTFRQRKVKHLQVLLDPVGRHAFRDAHDASLHLPPVAEKIKYLGERAPYKSYVLMVQDVSTRKFHVFR